MAIVLGPTTPPTLAPLRAALVQRPGPRHALSGCRRRRPAARPGRGSRSALWRGAESRARPRSPGRGSDRRRPRRRRDRCRGRPPGPASRCCSACRLGSLLEPRRLVGRRSAGASRTPWPERLSLDRWLEHAGAAAARRPGPRSWSGSPPRCSRWSWSPAASRTRAGAGAAPGRGALTLIYLPLLVPQIGFLFGVQVLLVWARPRRRLARPDLDPPAVRAALRVPGARRSLPQPRSALCAQRAGARQAALAGLDADQAGDAAAPGPGRARGRLRGQRRPVPADPVRRRRPLRARSPPRR